MKITYTAKTADGREFTRTSARQYTHASIVTLAGREFVKFASSEELAHKAAASHFAVPNAFRINPRAHWEESQRMEQLKAQAIIEVVELTS